MEETNIKKKDNRTRKNIISIIITILILLMGMVGFRKLASAKKSTLTDTVVKKERRKVDVSSFTAGTTTNIIEIDGRLQAHQRVSLTAKVQGIMQEGTAPVKIGGYFKKGDILYIIDSKEAGYNLKAAKSTLLTAITQMLPDIKFDYPQSLDRWQAYLNQFDVDRDIQPLPTPSNDQEKYFVAGRNLQNQYYQIKSQETRLTEYFIYAPFSGVVTETNVYPGTLISPGQVLCTMINTGLYEITAPIPLEQLKFVKVGQSVTLKSDDLDKKWTGKVNRIGTQIDPSTQNIPLFINVTGRGLKDGMYVKGELKGNSLSDVVKLPKRIFLSPNTIYIIQDSTIQVAEVLAVKREADHVLVQGLDPTVKVITGSLSGLFEGQKVTY